MTADAAGIDRTAILGNGAVIAAGASIGPHAQIGDNSTLGPGSLVAGSAVIGAAASIGARARIGAGAYVGSHTMLSDDVVLGPNSTILDSDIGPAVGEGPSAPTTICEGASIGANASVLAGVTVGPNAVIGAGAVVTKDVPPYATAVGSPARIVGYQSSPGFIAKRRLVASVLSDTEFPLLIGRATLSRQPLVVDLRGSLVFGEFPASLPFAPKRYFLVFDVPGREVRGEHAHHALHQLLICVRGECSVAVDDGVERGEVTLDRPDAALHLPPMVWGSQYRYSPDAVLLVLASDTYDPADYIRDYAEFQQAVTRV